MNIMSGYSMTIRRLDPEDARIHKVNLDDHDPDMCVGVYGTDLGECLCAVVDMRPDCAEPLVYYDPALVTLPRGPFAFADQVASVLHSMFEHIRS